MRKGGQLERLLRVVIEKNIINTRDILKDLRNPDIPKEITSMDIPIDIVDDLLPLLKSDIFSSMEEINSVALHSGMLAIKYAIDHPNEFDLDKLFDETDEDMVKEGW